VAERDGLPPRWRGKGPLIVEQMDATTVAPPGAKVFNDRHGYLHIELG
jgi:N-methylhydantoinase A/oxoprolinase/acetone carboxylase beta subunit